MYTGSNIQSVNYNNSLYQLEDVSVTFGKLRALSGIKLAISAGEIIFITGASGSGKTTLLRLLAGEIKPTEGRIFKYFPNMVEANIFQDLRLLENFTVYDNLMVSYREDAYLNALEFEQDIYDLARIFNLTDRLKEKVVNLNGGLKQKVAILRSLLMRPQVILADEPTSSLDLENAKKIFEIFQLYNRKQKLAIIWTSHSRELVKHFTGKIIHLDNGKLVYSGHACFI